MLDEVYREEHMNDQLIWQSRIWKIFQCFSYRNFKNHPSYDKIRPKSNQPARLYATAKTHKFNDLDEITVEKLKFRPIVDQTGTATYDATKVVGEYLKPLALNECKINNFRGFA